MPSGTVLSLPSRQTELPPPLSFLVVNRDKYCLRHLCYVLFYVLCRGCWQVWNKDSGQQIQQIPWPASYGTQYLAASNSCKSQPRTCFWTVSACSTASPSAQL